MAKILQVRNLHAGYELNDKVVHAVRDVSFDLEKGEFLGIAGESGCGKSTLAFAITRLLRSPGKVFDGEILFDGKNILKMEEEEVRKIRWKEFSIVFQASMNVLNPIMKIKDQIYDAITYHTHEYDERLFERAKELLEYTNISPKYLDAYPHQLSGGMKQRVVIAIALSLNPKLIIMDEPTTALDVVVQRRILQEVDKLRKKFGFSVIFITHDLSLLIEISDSLMIMYAGRVVEKASAREIFSDPLHPYTRGLMNSFPPLLGKRRRLHGIPGYPPDLSKKIEGCAFYPRCSERILDKCKNVEPQLMEIKKGHLVACNLYSKSYEEGAKNGSAKG